jgi:hypothetical protein
VFWSTLLGQKYPLVNDLIEYITVRVCLTVWSIQILIIPQNNTSVKGVNKDLWAMVLVGHLGAKGFDVILNPDIGFLPMR